MAENLKWVDDFLDALDAGFAGMDFNTSEPIDCFEIFPLYAEQGINRIMKIIKNAGIENAENPAAKKLAQKMHSPSVIRVELIFALIKARLANLQKAELARIAGFYNSLLQSWCLEDPYAKGGKNIIHNKNEIRQFIKNLKPANPEIARELGKLTSACYNLSYGLYSDINPQICYENFGPYDVSGEFGAGHILVIKQFQHLRPVRLWKGRIEDLPYRKIRLYCVYKNVKFSIDAASHSNYEGNLIEGLKYFGVDINGKMAYDLFSISQAAEEISLKAMQIWESLTSMDFEQAKIIYLEQRSYNYISLCNRLRLDWKPTKDMLKAVKNKQLVKEFLPKFDSPEDESNFWRMMCDPRIDTKELINKKFSKKIFYLQLTSTSSVLS